MLKTITNVEDTVPCDRLFSTLAVSDTFDPNFLTSVFSSVSMASMNDQCSSLADAAKECEMSAIVEHHRKMGNFRQRIRSLREECDDGPLLASAEDVEETDDDTGFVVACRGKRGRRSKEFISKDTSKFDLELETCSLNPNSTETDSSVPECSKNNQICSGDVLKFMKARYPDMNFSELEILFQVAAKQWANFEELSGAEMGEKLDEVKRRQSSCEDKNENMEKVPSKPAWIQMKPSNQSRVIDFNECTICLGAWDSDGKIKLEECGHCFHSECLQNWMKMKNTCPFCCTYSLSPNDFPKLT